MTIIQKQFYKDITKRFNEVKQEIEAAAQTGVRDDIIQEKINEHTEELENLIAKELNKFATTIEGEIKTLKESHAPKTPEYTDPAAELLKRQDFELKLKTISDRALSDMISEAEDLNDWELRTLFLAAEKRLPIEGGGQANRIRIYLQDNVNLKLQNDPKYKELSKDLATARTHPKGAIYLGINDWESFHDIKSSLQVAYRMNRLA